MPIKNVKNITALDNAFFLFFSVLALLKGQATIFYMMYFFWWQELIRTMADTAFLYKKRKIVEDWKTEIKKIYPRYFLLFIYLIFIVVFFGFIANWDNTDLVILNFEVLLFRNIFFDCNLIVFALNVFYRTFYIHEYKTIDDAFNPRTIIMHISIILGAIISFFVVRRYPEIFVPGNMWASVAIITPFLLLRVLIRSIK
ncbi:MAG: hypothetical protein ACK5NK_00815 [Niabella sp.]